MKALVQAAESGFLPDALIRVGIRQLLRARLREEGADNVEAASNRYAEVLEQLRREPVAINTQEANEQHYEAPTGFFAQVLGPHMKYSACYWPERTQSLADAEDRMLSLYAERADLEDGQSILDLGCGWGAFSLWAAARYRRSRVLAISNSSSQKAFIDRRALELGLDNLAVRTADINQLAQGPSSTRSESAPAVGEASPSGMADDLTGRFDRIVSVEMFEHVRNYATLLASVAQWLKPEGKLFVHIFGHRQLMYPFETEGSANWMGRHFFTGGLMPAQDTLLHFQDCLRIERRWLLSGRHYEKTARAWLRNLDANRKAVGAALEPALAASAAATPNSRIQRQRWRLFFMACEELFGWNNGNDWLVCHYLFEKRG